MAIVKDVWQGKDNHFNLMLESTDEANVKSPLDTSLVTKVDLEFENSNTLTVNRDDADAPINWWDADLDQGEIQFELGDFASGMTPGAYNTRLVIYSLATPDGVVWASFARHELVISIH